MSLKKSKFNKLGLLILLISLSSCVKGVTGSGVATTSDQASEDPTSENQLKKSSTNAGYVDSFLNITREESVPDTAGSSPVLDLDSTVSPPKISLNADGYIGDASGYFQFFNNSDTQAQATGYTVISSTNIPSSSNMPDLFTPSGFVATEENMQSILDDYYYSAPGAFLEFRSNDDIKLKTSDLFTPPSQNDSTPCSLIAPWQLCTYLSSTPSQAVSPRFSFSKDLYGFQLVTGIYSSEVPALYYVLFVNHKSFGSDLVINAYTIYTIQASRNKN